MQKVIGKTYSIFIIISILLTTILTSCTSGYDYTDSDIAFSINFQKSYLNEEVVVKSLDKYTCQYDSNNGTGREAFYKEYSVYVILFDNITKGLEKELVQIYNSSSVIGGFSLTDLEILKDYYPFMYDIYNYAVTEGTLKSFNESEWTNLFESYKQYLDL